MVLRYVCSLALEECCTIFLSNLSLVPIHQMFNLARDLKELKKESSNLRGGEKGEHSVQVIENVKNLMKSLSGGLQTIQHHYQEGRTDKAGAALKAIIGDSDTFVQVSKDMKQIEGLENKMLLEFDDTNGIDNIEDISDSMLGEQINTEIFDDIAKLSKEFSESLEDIDLSQYAEASSKKKTNIRPKSTYHQEKRQDAQFSFSSFTKMSTNSFDFSSDSGVKNGFITNPTTKSIHKQMHFQRKGISLPKISTFVSVRDHGKVMLKHQIRQQAMGICLPSCEVSNTEDSRACNCERLFGCVQKLDEYDMAV